MKQITVKRAVEALYWIDNNEHHIVGTEWPKDPARQRMEDATHVYFQNHHEKLRVPVGIATEVFKFIKPNKRKFDTRMYALTPAGKMRVRK